ncbi:hypothetical protein DPMN_187594 [Dreissena polymorpha]|uniref:RNA helicase n=1 Tax=Dreissena polymorpha TaxID=45954 RepID=A0A9D4IAK6_DREPO|nr:hypothetical protein DPMN_187594 [Dreissena polymorpha]
MAKTKRVKKSSGQRLTFGSDENRKKDGVKNNIRKIKTDKPQFHAKSTSRHTSQKHNKKKFVAKNKKKDETEEMSDFEEVTEKNQLKPESHQKDDEPDSDTEQTDVRALVKQQNRKNKKSGGFQSMGLSRNVYIGITRKGYKIPTPIQRKTIPLIMEGKDVVAMARTGSGKTAAFLVPMFEKLQTHSAQAGARALIMSPTRELAVQTLKFAKELGKYTGLRAAVVLGGDRMEDQFAALHANPDIIIATPGRFMHVVVEMDLKLKSIQYVVFDEADRLFEMGFQEQLNEVLNRLPESRQTLLFSATLPKLLVEFAKAGLHDPTLIRLDVETKLSDQLKLSFLQCRLDDKLAVLLHLLQHVIPVTEQTVVFAATKHHVEYLSLILQKANISCTYIYSSLDPTARKISIAKFQHHKVRVLIVTDLAARGIDIPLLDNVINYNFPGKPKLFVHRVGRVARAGRKGVAYSLVSPDEIAHVYDLHVFLGRSIKYVPVGTHVEDADGLYGRVPQVVIDEAAETLRAWHAEVYDIGALVKVCSNAYERYIRSRPQPAPESVKRFKERESLGQPIGMHPLYGVEEDNLEGERMKLLDALKSYKSSATIFEINSTAKNASFGVMKKKRDFHGRVVESRQRQLDEYQSANTEDQSGNLATSQPSADDHDLQNAFSVVIGGKKKGSDQAEKTLQTSSNLDRKSKKRKVAKQPVRDEENYISYRPSDYQSEQGLRLGSSFDREASSVLLEVVGDEEGAVRKQQNTMRWDRKKKKFVRDSGDDPKRKKIRTESGALISASYKSNVYPLKKITKCYVRYNKVKMRYK